MQALTSTDGRPIHPAARGWLGFAEPLETRVREGVSGHLADVSAVATVFTPPTQWLAARDRWERYLELTNPNVDRLAEHLVTGAGDAAGLRALALAELGGPIAESDLRSMLADRIHHALSELWAPVAARAYKACAKTFDSAAAVDDGPQLDAAADSLAAAARLCGADANVALWATQRLTLGLTVTPGKAHIRKVATAFSTQPDRWRAVRELGATLRAAEDPLTEYPVLPPFQVVVDTDRTIQRWDPLDGELPQGWQTCIDGWLGS